jgi:ketosteroid isomerase-like protein
MILSICSRISCLVAVAGLTAVAAEKLDLDKAVGSLIEAERAYAKQGAEKGFRAASLANFSDDAVIFAPALINGKKFWTAATEDPVINWGPGFAAIARSGELGYTTGPAVYFQNRNDPKPVGYGHFVSIWQKNSEGIWQVRVDVGVNHTEPSEALGEVKTWVPSAPLAHPESARTDFEKAQAGLSEALKKGEGAAILARASEDVRIYRRGALPIVGKPAAQKILESEHGKTSRTRTGGGGGGMSKAGDLAYDYGEYTSERDGEMERGIYFCIWRLDSDNAWKLVVDLQKKAPSEKK